MSTEPTRSVHVRRWDDGTWSERADEIAAEEPLQILLDGAPVSVVMRTPGHDIELVLGLLFAERVLVGPDAVTEVHVSAELATEDPRIAVRADLVASNTVDLRLRTPARPRQRTFFASSACGICGATTLDDLSHDHTPLPRGTHLDPAMLPPLTDRLREAQQVFARTGGLHAAALFAADGSLVTLREDVGRHNAVDKVVGRALLDGALPLSSCTLVVSGRAGYEVTQKAIAAGISALVAVGAPSSLAVATARRFGLTLVGFLRGHQFNVYSEPDALGVPS